MSRQVLVVGEPSESEFQTVTSWLASRAQVTCVKSATEACETFADGRTPELIVFVQSRPGQSPTASVERLHRMWPLARLVLLLGSWCEGETRNGRPGPGVWRIFWYDFTRRLGPVFDGADSLLISWNMPRLASEGERLLGDLSANLKPGNGLVSIATYFKETYEFLASACHAIGYVTDWYRSDDVPKPSQAIAGIWDARRGDNNEWSQIERFARSIAPASVLVTQSFPRIEDWQQAAHCGVNLIAKPFQLPDLWRALGNCSEVAGPGPNCPPLVNCST